ncbi:MAG: SDR family NAD(P)-dependent oxidoreductase, partial [Candidatus Eremiobacteraeota bacterium]|nr:SDR family NAD(P)-dependent oxidoreductase [Candidatus Eremiobacteraeota bacterium]
MNQRRAAIVTGASSGIGMALAERAVRAGWDVFAVGRRTERLEELARTVEAASGRLATLSLDVRAPQAASKIVRGALERFGRIDVL